MKHISKIQLVLCLIFFILSKAYGDKISDYSFNGESVTNLSVAKVKLNPSRKIELQHYGLQADHDLTIESLSDFYNEIDQAPFGPYIDISFEALGQNFNFESVPLSKHPAPKYNIYESENEITSSSSLPMATYMTTFKDVDESTALLVVTLNPTDQTTYVYIQREHNPDMAVHTFKLAKLGFASHEASSLKLQELEESQQLLADEGESYIAYNLVHNGADNCGIPAEATAGTLEENVETPQSADSTDRTLQTLPYFTGCHNADSKSFAANMGVYINYSVYSYYRTVLPAYNAFLSSVFAINSYTYYRQFRVQWFVREIRVMTTVPTGTEEWNTTPDECPYTGDQLYAFQTWANARTDILDRYSNWLVLTVCRVNPTSIIGTAFISVLCGNAKYSINKTYISSGTWLVGHEVGHNFGSQHAWTYVTNATQGSVGGIMDYNTLGKLLDTDPNAPGEYGFHMTSKTPICTHLQNRIVPANIGGATACFTEIAVDDGSAICGNGILEDNEECELSYGAQPGASPTCCKNCKLVNNANCSVDTECCQNCRIQNRSTCTTIDGRTGHCGIGPSGGICQHIDLIESLDCDNVAPYGTCYLTCKTGLYIYLANEGVCSYSGETVANNGYCLAQQCLQDRYEWTEGPLNKCVCKNGLSTGLYSQSINCVDRRGEIVAANLCTSPKPAYTSCTCSVNGDFTVTEADYI